MRACGSRRPARSSRRSRATAASAPSRPCAARSTAGSGSAPPATATGSSDKEAEMQIAIPLFDRFTALDAVGPYEVLSRLPGARVDFVAAAPGAYRTETRMLTLNVERSYADVPAPEILVFPGGFGTRALMHDEPTLDWVRAVHERSRYTTSVCTGSLVLGAAGLLKGLDATTHWMSRPILAELGARPVEERVVEQGKIITAAGAAPPTPRRPGPPPRRGRGGRAGQDHHGRRGPLGDRHGAPPGGPSRRPGGGAGHPARDRVRPATAVRRRLAGEGAREHRRD